MKLALHTVSYSGNWGQTLLPVEKVVDKAAAFGYDGVELVAKRPHASPMDMTTDDRKRLKDYIASRKLEIPCVAGYFDFSSDNMHPDIAWLQKELLFMRETLRLAVDLGSPIVRTFSGYHRDAVAFKQQWDWCLTGLKESAKMAEDFGVTLALQNHSEVTQHYQDVLQMVQEVGSPALKVCLDCPYIALNDTSIPEAVKAVGKLMVYSHLSDHGHRQLLQWAPAGRHGGFGGYYNVTRWFASYLGEGGTDYPTFIKNLRSIGYDGYLSYEICGPIPNGGSEENLDVAAKKALAYMRGLLAKA